MEIKITYVGILNDINGVWCGFKPDGVVVTEERAVLYPKDGFELESIVNKERFSAVWLKDGDCEDNYVEVEIIENNNFKPM